MLVALLTSHLNSNIKPRRGFLFTNKVASTLTKKYFLSKENICFQKKSEEISKNMQGNHKYPARSLLFGPQKAK